MKRILILCFTPILRDPRLRRQVEWLSPHFQVGVAGYIEKNEILPGAFKVFPVSPGKSLFLRILYLLTKFFRLYSVSSRVYSRMYSGLAKIDKEEWDLVLVNDLLPLELGLRIANGKPVHFDAHEFYTDAGEMSLRRRLYSQGYLEWLARTCIPRATSVSTVCESIAELYHSSYGVHPHVIMNTPGFEDLQPQPVNPECIRIIHHGGCNANRKIDRMIDVMRYTDSRFVLDLMLVKNQKIEYDRLVEYASGMTNVNFVDPVPMPDIPSVLNQKYDIGLFLLEPQNTNHQYALPNKLFEFIQARLAVAIGPAVEMGKIVDTWQCGFQTIDFNPETMAKVLNNLTGDQLMEMKNQSNRAARVLCGENEEKKLINILQSSLSASN